MVRNSYEIDSSLSNFDNYHDYEIILCPLCYAETAEEGQEAVAKIGRTFSGFGIIFGLLFISIFYFMFKQFQNISGSASTNNLGLFPIIIGIVVLLLIFFVYQSSSSKNSINKMMSDNVHVAMTEKQEFLKTVDNPTFIKNYSDSFKLTCFQCGSDLTSDVMTCPFCGNSTDDEHQYNL